MIVSDPQFPCMITYTYRVTLFSCPEPFFSEEGLPISRFILIQFLSVLGVFSP